MVDLVRRLYLRKFLSLILLMLAVSIVGSAATITYNAVVTYYPDLIQVLPDNTLLYNSFGDPRFGVYPSVLVQQGDTLVGTITFANGPIHIEATNPSNAAAFYFFTGGNPQTSATTTFLGASGTLGVSNPQSYSSGGPPLVGLLGANGNGPFDFSFTGISFVLHFDTLASPTYFSLTEMHLHGEELTIPAVTPEPQSFALMALGCVALVCRRASRGRRSEVPAE